MAAVVKPYSFLPPSVTVDHLVIGGGVVGLAVAERLLKGFAGRTTFLVERHGQPGQETSSRNSEVIHSGLYYPTDSLKTALCIKGRKMLYDRCQQFKIPHRKTGKLILATSKAHKEYLAGLESKAHKIEQLKFGKVPLSWLSGEEVREIEPDVGPGVIGALLSPETGIVSSHALMENLESEIAESDTGELVYGTRVVRIDRAQAKPGAKRGDGSEDGWVVQTLTGNGMGKEGERSAVLAKVVVNAAGLNAHHVLNEILPPDAQARLYFAKGSYYSYRGPGVNRVRHLLYPCPDSASLAGLGTHLTMNLDGDMRFGPDVEFIDAPQKDGKDEMDFWEKHLAVTEHGMQAAIQEVKKFLPNVKDENFAPDYVGIRPKLSKRGEPAEDFSITHPRPGFISLLGIESPGLTSCLSIAVYVEALIRKEVWGLGKGSGKTVSESGTLAGWA